MNFKTITWNEIEKYIEKIGKEIESSKIKPDCIVSIFTGGIVPAKLMSDYFNVRDIYPIFAKYYDKNHRLNKITVMPFNYNVERKTILLIDDISDSGKTINEVLKVLELRKPNRITTCVMIYKTASSSKPSFYGEEVDPDTWINFPWEKYESKSIIGE